MPETTPNVELLQRTLAFIESHPEQWYQDDWRNVDDGSPRCGTSYCFAGWAAMLNGSTWDVPDSQIPNYDWYEDPSGYRLILVDGGRKVSDVAREALGLTERQGSHLFDGGNSIEDLRDIVGEICGEAAS